MKYAIVLQGGKQYKVSEGDVVEVDRLTLEPNDTYAFSFVLLYVNDDQKLVGTPMVEGVSVVGTVVEQKKTRKIRVAKFKSKVRYRKVFGHRSMVTRVKIEKIEAKGTKATKEEK